MGVGTFIRSLQSAQLVVFLCLKSSNFLKERCEEIKLSQTLLPFPLPLHLLSLSKSHDFPQLDPSLLALWFTLA